MNTKLGILSLFLSGLITACSSDGPVSNEDGENNGKELGYIAVNIVQPKSTGTREGTDGFMDGTEDENLAKDATFIIYKTQNNTPEYLSTQTITLEAGTGSGTNPSVEKIYNAVLVINADDKIGNDGKFNGVIYCVLNAPTEIRDFGNEQNTDKSETHLKQLSNNYDGHTKGSFIMSNSTHKYYKLKVDEKGNPTTEPTTEISNDIICGTKFTNDNYFLDPNEAIKNPVDIYVERVVAKVNTTPNNVFNNQKPDPFNTGNDNEKLTIRITGMEIANIATKSYLFKNVDTSESTGSGWPKETEFPNVWDPANRRCYWETNVELSFPNDYTNKSYNQIVGNTTNPKVYDEFSNFKQTFYIQPNTSNTKTAVLVTAQLLDKNNEPADLVWIKGGYFTNNDAFKLVCNNLKAKNWAIKTIIKNADGTIKETKYRRIEPTDLKWARHSNPEETDPTKKNQLNEELKDYQAIAQVYLTDENSSICKAKDVETGSPTEIMMEKEENGETKKRSYTIDDLNGVADKNHTDRLAHEKSLFAEVFKNGLCYYFVNIDQTSVFSNKKEDLGRYEGVVRNHIYDLTLDGIKGIGTAVFDPSETIIPEKPKHDQFYNLAARINVLKWRVVSQHVNFEGNK